MNIQKQLIMRNLFSILLIGLTIGNLSAQVNELPLPAKMPREQLIEHKGHTLSYSSAYVVSSWVAYKMSNATVNKETDIKGKYLPDPEITTRSADKKDYKGGGYVMAQLCNYLDVMHIDGAVEETFYMSNIAAMKQTFYQHIWLKTDDLIRLWIADKGEFIIYSGVVTKDAPFGTFGKNKVSIPKNFYKVVYDAKNQEAIAFKFKNGMSSGTLKSYTMSVEELQEITGIDYFPNMNEEAKKKLISKVNYDFWDFTLEEEL